MVGEKDSLLKKNSIGSTSFVVKHDAVAYFVWLLLTGATSVCSEILKPVEKIMFIDFPFIFRPYKHAATQKSE